MRAARTGADRRDPGELIQELSGSDVLSAFGASAKADAGDLRRTLAGLVQKSRVARLAEIGPPSILPTAELFTSSGDTVLTDLFPRW